MRCFRVKLKTVDISGKSAMLSDGTYVNTENGELYTIAESIVEAAEFFPEALAIFDIGPGYLFRGADQGNNIPTSRK